MKYIYTQNMLKKPPHCCVWNPKRYSDLRSINQINCVIIFVIFNSDKINSISFGGMFLLFPLSVMLVYSIGWFYLIK